MRAKTALILVIFLTVTVSGCVDQIKPDEAMADSKAKLVGSVSDQKITEESPGEVTLNARNMANKTESYIVQVKPVGDYNEIISITNRMGEDKNTIKLGEALEGGTTGENFAKVNKELNVTATVKVRAKLYTEEIEEEPLDTEIYTLKMVEE